MSAAFDAFDRLAMARALALAERGLETTDPNPRVGCVVARDGRIVGEGWHAFAGEPHAEVFALQASGEAARGATAYVTLEPCSHHGRTPPCVEALLAARIARVVYALGDPDPRVDGRGAAILRAAGVAVESGLLQTGAEELNPGFLMRLRSGRPFIRLKTGSSLDGRTALANGESRWITGEAARRDVQRWRARSSAVLTGIQTVIADDPRLDVRDPPDARRQPLRVILDSKLRVLPTARVLEPPGRALVFTAMTGGEPLAHGAQVETVPASSEGGLDLMHVVRRLAELQMNEVLVEAGATLTGAFLAAGLVDEWLLYVSPSLLGEGGRPLASVPALERLDARVRFEIVEHTRLGGDLRLRLRPVR